MKLLNLTICAGAEPALYEPHLVSWASAGLLSGVVSCSLQSLSGSFAEADCRFADGTSWQTSRLDEVLGRERYRTVTLAALRTEGLSADRRLLELEAAALDAMRSKFLAVDVRLRAVTVAAARSGAVFTDEAFSPLWDLHLLHDSRMLVDAESPYLSVRADDAPALCAITALCAGGGWAFSEDPWIANEQIDRVVKPVRLVRPQLRILLVEKFDESDLVFASAPWPEPSDINTQRFNNPGVVPPMTFAGTLARKCRFTCSQPRPASEPAVEDGAWWRICLRKGKRFVNAVKLLFAPLKPSSPKSDVEQALETFASMPHDDVTSTVRSLSLAGMPGVFTESWVTPKTWEAMRQALYGLVDGSEMPPGMRRPIPPPGGDQNQILIWCYPAAVAPPPDAEPLVLPPRVAEELGAEKVEAIDAVLCRRVQSLIDKEEARRRAREDKDADDEGDESGEDSNDGTRADPDSEDPLAEYRQEEERGKIPNWRIIRLGQDRRRQRRALKREKIPNWRITQPDLPLAKDDQEVDDEAAEMSTPEDIVSDSFRNSWDDWLDRWRWTPLWQLADHLGKALEVATANFARNKSRCYSQKEYEHAIPSKHKFNRVLILIGIVAVAGGLIILERHLGLLGSLFPIGVKTTSLVDFYILVGFIGLGIAALGYFGKKTALDALDYADAEEKRLKRSEDALLYSQELSRLHTAVVEFDDHQKVIRRLLHEPFGIFEPNSRKSVDVPQEEHVPASMLISLAQIRPDRLEEMSLQMRAEIFRQGWLTEAHAQTEAIWSKHYEQKINDEFPRPDEDNGPAGVTRYREVFTGDALVGPREHFRQSVTSGGGEGDVRNAAARQRAAEALENVPFRMEMLTDVYVLRGPAMKGVSTEEFLELRGGSKDTFDASLLSPTASPFAHARSSEDSLDFSAPVRVPGGKEDAFDLWASWRMAVSNPIPPSHLNGWQKPPDDDPVAPPTFI